MKRCVLAAVALLWVAAAVQFAPTVFGATVGVDVEDVQFDAATVNITAGDTVQWTWTGSLPHTVTSNSAESFDSGAPTTSGTFSHTFSTPGTFTYICIVHAPSMAGTVNVAAAVAATSTATTVAGTATATRTRTATPETTGTPATATGTPPTLATPDAPSPGPPTEVVVPITVPSVAGGAANSGALPNAGTGPRAASPATQDIALALAALAVGSLALAAAARVWRLR